MTTAGTRRANDAVAQDAIERRGAVAFLANVTALTGTASAEYINSRRVPVIGWDGGADFPYEYPMFFPQTSAGAALGRSSGAGLAMQMGAASKTKFGIMFCVETAECEKVIKELAAEAVAHGRREVYRTKISIAQPDFTAECLSARNAGVEVLVIVVDTNSVGRVRGVVRSAELPPDPVRSLPVPGRPLQGRPGVRSSDDDLHRRSLVPEEQSRHGGVPGSCPALLRHDPPPRPDAGRVGGRQAARAGRQVTADP